jgi:hypothetical protein
MATNVTVNAGQGSTQVTVITGEGSTSYSVSTGARGPAGTNGTNGTNGAAGPNSVTTSTSSNLTGFIAADGTNVSGATAGATAATANTIALRDATGGSNFAAVGATSVTSSGVISTTGASASISTSGVNGSISTSGLAANIFTIGQLGFISTSGFNADIYTQGTEARIYTAGADATIFTEGANATIFTEGANANIGTTGTNAYIQSRSTFKLFNGTYNTTLSHSPTADRAIAFPNKDGTVAMIDAETHTGAHAFSSTTRPTSAGTGTPAATSLITRADGDARYGGPFYDLDGSASHSESAATTPVKTVVLPVGTYLIEYAKLGILHTDTTSRTVSITVNFTGGTVTMQDRGIQSHAQSATIAGLTYTGQGGTLNTSVLITNASPSFGGGAHYFTGRIVVTAETTLRIFGFCSVTPTNPITYETSGILRKIA